MRLFLLYATFFGYKRVDYHYPCEKIVYDGKYGASLYEFDRHGGKELYPSQEVCKLNSYPLGHLIEWANEGYLFKEI